MREAQPGPRPRGRPEPAAGESPDPGHEPSLVTPGGSWEVGASTHLPGAPCGRRALSSPRGAVPGCGPRSGPVGLKGRRPRPRPGRALALRPRRGARRDLESASLVSWGPRSAQDYNSQAPRPVPVERGWRPSFGEPGREDRGVGLSGPSVSEMREG